ncbi:hypothetical protein Cgig2_033907 [Carnegiea gigantea]|uniref:CUE domain-containing protein n=1 Tax=Carnegiea gigantea TaxID=171969 RepID=A0A9Q1JM09_9CARY|nr:hypothetical protein Cgig2_033907 [Carnegiea gigantea]
MKSSTSTLNPFAQSYVPLAQRELLNKEEDYQTPPTEASYGHPVLDDQKVKGQQFDGLHGVPSENPHEIDAKLMDEDSEMDLVYLQMTFPDVSDQSLLDVYNVNRGDLEAAVDMLNHLESADDGSDALDVKIPQEPVPSGECSSMKAVNVTGESSSASGSPGLAVPT